MTTTITMSTPLAKRVLATLATLAFAFCMALAIGAAPAYAAGENPSTTGESASGTTADPNQEQPTSTDSVAGAVTPAVGNTTLATDVETPDPATPATSSNDQDESTGDRGLEAAGDKGYPKAAPSTNVSIGIVPNGPGSENYRTDPVTNAIYVDMQSEVGKGVSLSILVDYIRVGDTTYSGFTGVTLPDGDAGSYTVSSPAQGFMFSWYTSNPPFGQGTYYSDPGTNPALMNGGGAAGGNANMVPASVNLDNYKSEDTFMMNPGQSPVSSRFYADVPFTYSNPSGPIEVELPYYRNISASDSARYTLSPAFFETAGMHTIVAQLTYMQECRAGSGANELVGYVLHASNPVVFNINVAPRDVVNLSISAQDRSGDPVDISGDNFIVELEKVYIDTTESAAYVSIENMPYSHCDNFTNPCLYTRTTPGHYRLTINEKKGVYRKYIEYFEITQSEFDLAFGSDGKTIFKKILMRPGSKEQFTITFYDDNGATLLAGKQYTEGTVAESIDAPATPTKAATDKYKYIFKEWRAEVVGIGELDTTGVIYNDLYPVSCNVNYIAVYRTILLKNEAGQSIVYATGDLFSNDALPAGVLAYGLSSAPLTGAEQNEIIASHPKVMAADSVLGMVQVDLTQYNDDAENTTTNVTEHNGLNGLKLTFDLAESGMTAAEGDRLKILQIHKKDESSPEEIIEHTATVIDGKVEITLNGKLSTFVFMMADPYPGDDGKQDAFLGLVPTSGFEYEVDENGVIHVYLESNVGKSLDLGTNLNYFRIGEVVYDARDGVAYVPLSEDQHEAQGTMICWYNGDAPLPQGAYSTSVNQWVSGVAMPTVDGADGAGSLTDSVGLVQYNVTAFSFLFNFFADGENGWQYEIPNRLIAHVMSQELISGNSLDTTARYAFRLANDEEYVFSARNSPKYLLFNKVGEYTYTAQASYAAETVTDIIDPATGEPYHDELGNTYQRVDYTIYTSYPVVFHINVKEAPAAKLLLSANNGSGAEVALDSSFKIELYKQLEDESYALCSSANSYDGATAGAYKLKVTSKYGTYEVKEISFSLTIDEIEAAGEVDPSITKTITLTAIPDPTQFTVVFTDYDGAVLSTAEYNENTLGEAVVAPTGLTRVEDDDFTYKFDGWETEQDGAMVSTNISDVVSDKVYRAVYRAISKDVVSNSTIRVYATGGLFSQPRPDGVEKHELVVSEMDGSEKESLIRTYGGTVGKRTVDGVYVVDIIRHMTEGDSVSLTEGVGDVVLTFPTTLAEGTLANVYQLHQLSNGGTVVIEHNNLRVEGGSVAVKLDGRLSTFIVASAAEVEAADPDNGGQNGNGSGENGSSGNQGGITNGNTNNGTSGASGEESPKTPVADPEAGVDPAFTQDADKAASGADETLTEPVKAAPAAGDAALPATGDSASPAVLVLAALALLAAATALTTRTRRKTQL